MDYVNLLDLCLSELLEEKDALEIVEEQIHIQAVETSHYLVIEMNKQ